ncbi:hypothetical protein HYY69_07455 [Candidatus Woesearchaeota archaeon]|nr:hypothetical protein [Candidatus Woesearchaeota archaeon]
MKKELLSYSSMLIGIVLLVGMVALFASSNVLSNTSPTGNAVKAYRVEKPAPEWLTSPCSDSDIAKKNDMGKSKNTYKWVNLGTKGTISLKGNSKIKPETLTDACIDQFGQNTYESSELKEWYCQLLPGGKIIHGQERFKCPHGTKCQDGACIKK